MNPPKQVRCLSNVRHVITGFIRPVRLSKESFDAVVEHDLSGVCDGGRKCFLEQCSTRKQVEQDIGQAEARVMDIVGEVRTRSLVKKAVVKNVDDGLKKIEMKIGTGSNVLNRVMQEKNIDHKKNLILPNIPESCHTDAKVCEDHDVKEIGKINDALCGN